MTNQRLCFINGIVAAATEKYALVLPHWHERMFSMTRTMATDGTIFPFEHFYRKESFLELAKHFNFSIVTHLPPLKSHACIAQLSALDDAIITREIAQDWAAKFGVICMTPGNMFFHPTVLWEPANVPAGMWDAVMSAFKPAAKFQALLNHAILSMPTRQFITVHLRIEADAQQHCQKSHNEIDGFDFHDGRQCALTQTDYCSFLQTNGVPLASTLFIATGVPLSELDVLCTDFRCFDQVLLVGNQNLTYMEKAFFDFSMALEGSEFYGSLASTFSMQLYDIFRAQVKRTAFVNPYCTNGLWHCG